MISDFVMASLETQSIENIKKAKSDKNKIPIYQYSKIRDVELESFVNIEKLEIVEKSKI